MYNPKSFVGAPATNLFLYSSQFHQSAWYRASTTIVQNATVAPDGTLTAQKVVSALVTGRVSVGQSIVTTNGLQYTSSIYLKAAEWYQACIFIDSTAVAEGAYYGAGVIVNLITGVSSNPTTVKIVAVGNGWWKASITGTITSTGSVTTICPMNPGNANVNAIVGDGVSGVYMWGAQCEQNSFVSPLIATLGTTVSRTIPIKDMIGTNNMTAPSLTYAANNIFTFNGTTDYIGIADSASLKPAAITVCVWAQATSVASYQVLAAKGDVSTYGWELSNSTGNLRVTFRPDGVTNNITAGALVANEKFHGAFTYDGTTLKLYKNGIQTGIVTSSTPVINGTNRLLIGARAANSDASVVAGFTAGSVYSTAIYSRALTAAEVLQNFSATRSRYGL
jgi:hypothetical protein